MVNYMSLVLSEYFNNIIKLELKYLAENEHSNEYRTRISKIASQVITYLQSTVTPANTLQVSPFIEKMKLIDKKFEEAGKAAAFATIIYTLNLIFNLRSNLDPSRQNILKDPFILELRGFVEALEIKDEVEVAQKLYKFQKDVLLPALESVQTLKELQAFESIINDCNTLSERLSPVDTHKKHLEHVNSKMLSIWNLRICKLTPIYSFLLNYNSNQLEELNKVEKRDLIVKKIDGFITLFIKVIDNPAISREEKIAIYNALIIIQNEFEEYKDDRIGSILQKLSTALGIPKGIHSTFPIELSDLVKDTIVNKKEAAIKLYEFQKNVLLPALEQVTTEEELIALETLVDQCMNLKDKLASIDLHGALEALKSNIKKLWNIKLIQTNELYSFLLKYRKGQSDFTESENRIYSIENLKWFFSEFIKISNHPLISQEDKIALHRALCDIYEELAKYRDEKLLEPVLKDLCKAVNLPFPKSKSSANVKKKQYEQETFIEAVSSKKPVSRARNIQSTETVRNTIFTRIQESISQLDGGSPSLKKHVQQILSDINKLKNLEMMKGVDFSGLEEALNVIADPSLLNSTKEENKFIELLLQKYGISNEHAEKYLEGEKASALNARSSLVKALKRNASSLEKLIQAASIDKEVAKNQAIKERFDRFVSIYPLPELNKNFSTHFPILIRNFEAFTNLAYLGLENTWKEISKVYDDQSNGKFSNLIKKYSYINPRSNFSGFVNLFQEYYFKNLDLSAINKISNKQLIGYLEKILDLSKDTPGEFFKENYLKSYSDRHIWLFSNIENIKISFNQIDNVHQILACFNNSLYRHSLLQDNPRISHAEITMGSNSKTRYLQTKVNMYYDDALKGKITFQAADDELTKVAQEYGLEQFHKYTLKIPPKTNPREFLIHEMERFALAGHTQIVLNLYAPTVAHSLNIQIDPVNNIYRFFDDNIGLCEYKSLSEFNTQIKKFIESVYYNYDTYVFRLFKRI